MRLYQAVAWTLLLTCPALAATPFMLTLRDGAGNPVPDAVVYLQGATVVAAPSAPPVVIDQRDKVFVPLVTVIRTGTEVSFPNSDSVSHHVYSFARPNTFELPLYKGTRSPTVHFDHAGVVTLGCNIHDSMVGWIVVVDTPYFAKTDARGVAAINAVAAGGYDVFAWSPRLDPARPLSAGSVTLDETLRPQAVAVSRKLRAAAPAGALADGDY